MVFVISNQIFEPVEHSSPLVERATALKAKAYTKVRKRGIVFIANSKETDGPREEKGSNMFFCIYLSGVTLSTQQRHCYGILVCVRLVYVNIRCCNLC